MRFREIPIADEMREHHRRQGGKKLRRYMARILADGPELYLRVMTAQEPAGGQRGRMVNHVSVSVCLAGQNMPFRVPTMLECNEAMKLVKTNGRWEEFHGEDPRVRHFYDG